MKKKKKRSENPTPSSNAGSQLLSPGLADAYQFSGAVPGNVGLLGIQPPTPLGTTPLGHHGHSALISPISPSAPPTLPPSLAGLATAEPPPPPSVEAAPSLERKVEGDDDGVPASPAKDTTNEAGVPVPASPSAATVPTSPGSVTGSAAGVAGKPVTLTDLLSTTAGSHPPTPGASASPGMLGTKPGSPQLAPSADPQLPMWPPMGGVPQLPHVSAPSLWPSNYWGGYDMPPVQNQWGGLYSQPNAAGAPPATLPPPLPGVLPGVLPSSLPGAAVYSTTGIPSAGLEGDSPRSALLTMCGAWGALKAKPEKNGDDADLTVNRFPKMYLLCYRRAVPKGSCPKPLKTLRSVKW